MTADEFIAKWENKPGKERSTYAAFLNELTQLLGVDGPGAGTITASNVR